MEDYLSHVALFSNQDTADSGDKVRLMTVHAAKGLEFAHVFLCGMNEGIFPSRKIRTAEQMEEERRLAFVAMTRARLGLHISEAEGFNSPDSSVRYPSRFLLDVRPGLLQFENRPDDTLLARTRDHIRLTQRWTESSSASFAVGDRVAHPVFGPGTVTEIDTQAGAYVIAFDDMPTPRAIAFRVKLQRADG